jgi:hypothetical protein
MCLKIDSYKAPRQKLGLYLFSLSIIPSIYLTPVVASAMSFPTSRNQGASIARKNAPIEFTEEIKNDNVYMTVVIIFK